MNNRKYSDEQITKAKRLYKEGLSIYKIMAICGFKSTTPVRWHCSSKDRQLYIKRGAEWRKRHPERVKEIAAKAMKKHYKKIHAKTNG